ncbi:uncharacterized protein PF3D7_1120600-like [Microplitis mediator]|uniref:uncharacterized protein PF3D7_1120600-like n=1 Tax=Microplitis mediator TaxID=375433 RepID=UPI002555BAB1|nr:uncharacterized protein PF3D7_1120600-like [Microplitis mediator]
MNKKKLFSETNHKQKIVDNHSSEINLKSKSMHAVEYAEKAIQHDNISNKTEDKDCKPLLTIPKTKFTTKNKSRESCSTSSSRLKSFPAEEIRRIQHSPNQKIIDFSNNQQIAGQGDGFLQSLYSKSSKISDNNLELNPQYLPRSETSALGYFQKSNGQTHRPFVPISRVINSQEPHFIVTDHKDNFPDSNHSIQKQEIILNNDKHNPQILKNSINDFNKVKYEHQLVGDQNVVLHQQTNAQNHFESLPQNKTSVIYEQNLINENPGQITVHKNFEPEHFQTINYDPYNQQQTSNYGMTSPQDLMISRLKINQNFAEKSQQFSGHNYSNINCSTGLEINPDEKNVKKSLVTQRQLESQYHEYPPRRLFKSQEKEIKKKPIQFTPAMKHDQELLISKLRQQGINEEIIKRQFDALLIEQKRQLDYLEKLEQSEEIIDKNNKIPTRRKISRNNEDGKPEWMAHITPPRMTYATVEKLNHSNKNNKKQQQKKIVGFSDNLNKNQNAEQMIQYWQANDRQNGMYVNYRNGYQPWQKKIIDAGGQQCNCCHVQHQKQNQEISPLGNGYFMLYDPSYQYQNNQESPISCKTTHHSYPHDYYKQNNMKNQENSINNQTMIPNNKSVIEQSNSEKFGHCGTVNGKPKRNNGLQDLEAIKEAMEQLNNWENRKGLEYLENLNKKERKLKLNGVQDPDDDLMINYPFRKPPEQLENINNNVSANGLENQRNSNNPLPPPIFRTKNFDGFYTEYPQRKLN